MRADIHGGQERKRSVQGPDTEAQDLSPPNPHFPLATRGRSIQKCHERTHALHKQGVLVGYSITLSARASSLGGIVRPSARAVLRLTNRRNLVGCSIGSTPGLAPFRILST